MNAVNPSSPPGRGVLGVVEGILRVEGPDLEVGVDPQPVPGGRRAEGGAGQGRCARREPPPEHVPSREARGFSPGTVHGRLPASPRSHGKASVGSPAYRFMRSVRRPPEAGATWSGFHQTRRLGRAGRTNGPHQGVFASPSKAYPCLPGTAGPARPEQIVRPLKRRDNHSS